ncbi:RNA 2',3'-cyclic phosphodiesterase [Paenibacillus montanisoli]|uniref:RNA 2',3'-cyclic phosphodiesterase n=1 Tax=Paenibacillus montanisoli TaxID=2081970 RepID=A0A328TZK3_9BACL|nr:RNA 2',3'-cyclic phosphodiesterase [Paenibacillus montanisoli]RAP73186.1 RNA 2',3'-cyclic phosphodiesterase [Paenibacillus montanisoli]
MRSADSPAASSSVRLFAAVSVPDSVKQLLSSWCNDIEEQLPFRKWVHEQDYHITLQFLGDTPSERVSAIISALREAAAAAQTFELGMTSLGVFGRPATPSILWAGVEGDLTQLQLLQKSVSQLLEPLGFVPEERRFHPHLTIARNYTGEEPFERSLLDRYNVPAAAAVTWSVDAITLYKSRLQQRPMYEALSVVEFPR